MKLDLNVLGIEPVNEGASTGSVWMRFRKDKILIMGLAIHYNGLGTPG